MSKKISPKEAYEKFQATYKADGERAKIQYRSISALVDGLRCETRVRGFRLTLDERKSLGGSDKGPNPAELILSAFGACQEITYKLHAELLGIPLDGINVEVTGDIDLCGFYAVDDETRPGYSNITAEVVIDSPASDEDIERLTAAVDRHCPVLDILKNPTAVSINVRKKDITAAASHAL